MFCNLYRFGVWIMKNKDLINLQADDVLLNKKNGNIIIFTMFALERNVILEHLLGEKKCTYQYHDINYLADLEFYTPEVGKRFLLNLIDRIAEEHLIYFSEEDIITEHYKDYIRSLLNIKNSLYNQYSLKLELTEDSISISRACNIPTSKK